MKIKHLMIAGCLFTAFTLQSCIKEKDLYQAPPTTYSELNLQLDGDYLSTELPMARATPPTKINESETSYTFKNLDKGYYLVYVTGGKEILSSLVTVDKDTNAVN